MMIRKFITHFKLNIIIKSKANFILLIKIDIFICHKIFELSKYKTTSFI